jgi:two-component system, chemotaxis family, chemotaxis protein CheY
MSKLVFVIEDEKTSRVLISSFLRKVGVTQIVSSINGKHALEKLKFQKPDLIISDWNMPEMNGLDFFRNAKKAGTLEDIPFLMVTSEDKKEKIMEAVRSGVKNYLVKPLSPEIFGDKVKSLLPN